MNCYKEYGCLVDYNESVEAVLSLIEKVYTFHCSGGNLHIVLDDWNIEDNNLSFCQGCIDRARINRNDEDYGLWVGAPSFEQLDAEQACLSAMLALSLDQRATALAINDRILTKDSIGKQ